MQQSEETVSLVVERLRRLDNKEGYRLQEKDALNKMEGTLREIIELGAQAVPELWKLLNREETYSCLFALQALKRIKSPNSIFMLINFLNTFEDGDYWRSYEEAMFALTAIGKPAIKPLISEIISSFERKKFPTYLIGALTEIKSDEVYSFMVEIIEDYLKNADKYKGWFDIAAFTHDFDKQEKKEILPILKRILLEKELTEHEQIEIEETIQIIENPAKYEEQTKQLIKALQKSEKTPMRELLTKECDVKALRELEKDPEKFLKKYQQIFIGIDMLVYTYLKFYQDIKDTDIAEALQYIKQNVWSDECQTPLEGYLRSELKKMLAVRKTKDNKLSVIELKTVLGKVIRIIKDHRQIGESYIEHLNSTFEKMFSEK